MVWVKVRQTFLSANSANHLNRLVAICLCLFSFGCEPNELVQCEQILLIARDVNQSNQNLQDLDNEQLRSMKSWLQAAHKFNQAADKLGDLKIARHELMQYQNRLARIYRIYAQATYDAVSARENQNLSALESARDDAAKAGTLQRQLIKEINAYCLEPE